MALKAALKRLLELAQFLLTGRGPWRATLEAVARLESEVSTQKLTIESQAAMLGEKDQAIERRVDNAEAQFAALAQEFRTRTQEFQTQTQEFQTRMAAIESQFAALAQEFQTRMAPVESQMKMINRIIGVERELPTGDQASLHESALEASLAHLETRVLTYLEGPYLERVLELTRSSAQTSGNAHPNVERVNAAEAQ